MNVISKNLPPLFIFKLAVNLFIWKKILSLNLFKIITVSRSSTLLRVFLMGRSGCSTMKNNLGESPCMPKSQNFPLLLNVSTTNHDFLKRLIGTKFQQDYLPELFPIVPLNIHEKPGYGGIPPNSQKCTHLLHQKNSPLWNLLLLSKVSFLPHGIVIFI